MYKIQYDSDVSVWSPQGRIHQIDYAVEAMKQGSATIGLKNKTHAVLVALKRAANDLCSHQKKIYELDSHIGLSMAGLLSDGRILARFLQSECASHRWNYKEAVPTNVLNNRMLLKLQSNTQHYGRRPFGVGLIIAAYDSNGPHIIKTDPSGHVVESFASAIGSRSQSARTYLEQNLDKFLDANLEELIRHGVNAIRGTLNEDIQLSIDNLSIAVVGKNQHFKLLDEETCQKYVIG